MSNAARILAFAGSTRTDSFNKKLIKIAVQGARGAGAEVTLVDLRDFPMPMFDEDLEAREGLPKTAQEFRALMKSHQGLLIASPEYNSSISGVLKNTIDWASRPVTGEAPLACFNDKVAGIMSASPGALGGLRGLVHLRAILGNINVLVIPQQIAIPRAHEAISKDGRLIDEKQHVNVERIGQIVAQYVTRLHSN